MIERQLKDQEQSGIAMAQGNRQKFFLFGTWIALGLLIAAAVYPEKSLSWIRFLWEPPFLGLVQILCVGAFCFLIFQWLARKPLPRLALKWIYGLVFLPLLLLPVFRCYFKVPYIFCRACPSPCPWGLSRTFVFNSFVLLNLSGKFWCAGLCPFGTFQECQTQISKKNLKLFRWFIVTAYLILLVVTGMYFLTLFGSLWTEGFKRGGYHWDAIAMWVALAILAVAFWVPKFWCRYFCPVGTIAELTASFRRPSRPETTV